MKKAKSGAKVPFFGVLVEVVEVVAFSTFSVSPRWCLLGGLLQYLLHGLHGGGGEGGGLLQYLLHGLGGVSSVVSRSRWPRWHICRGVKSTPDRPRSAARRGKCCVMEIFFCKKKCVVKTIKSRCNYKTNVGFA